jgi:hypothetical protein
MEPGEIIMTTTTASRSVGVRAPDNQSTEQAPQQTVTRITELRTFLVEYGDERGIKHTTAVAFNGQDFFMPPNAEEWVRTSRSCAKWFDQGCKKLLEQIPPVDGQGGAAVPGRDEVDIG